MTTNEQMAVVAGQKTPGARDYQEDAFQIVPLQDTSYHNWLLVLADGMGGHVGGARASDLAISSFIAHFRSLNSEDIGQSLRQSLDVANNAIKEDVAQNPSYANMGCTLLACLLTGDELHWISVGDSPLWQLKESTMLSRLLPLPHKKNNAILRLNADHSMRPVLQTLVELGRLDADELETDPRINQLCSAVVGGDLPKVDQNYTSLSAGDCIILASDGLETLSPDEIAQIYKQHPEPQATTTALIAAIESRRLAGQDNATAVVYRHT